MSTLTQTTGTVAGRRAGSTAGRVLVVLALIIVAGLLLAYAWLAVEWQARPYLGVLLAPDGTVAPAYSLAQAPTPAEEAGLRVGDRITAIGGQALIPDYRAIRDRLSAALAGRRPGETVTVTFERPAATGEPLPAGCAALASGVQCTASVALTGFPFVDFAVQFGLSWLVGLVALIAAALVVARGGKREAARPVALLLAVLAAISAGLFDLLTTRRISPVVTPLALAMLGGVLVILALHFPVKLNAVRRRPALRFVPALALLAAVAIAAALLAADPADPRGPLAFGAGCVILGAAGLAAALLWRMKRAVSPALRSQSALTLLSLLLALAPALVWALSVGLRLSLFGHSLGFHVALVTPFLLLPPAAMLYALTQDVSARGERLISQSIVYGALAVLITLGYGLLVTGVALLTGSVLQASNPLVVAVTLFLAALLFVPLRNALEKQVDRVFYRTQRRYRERVEHLGQELTQATTLGEIVAAVRAHIDATLAPTHTLLFFPNEALAQYVAYGEPAPETDIRFAANSPLLRFLAGQQGALYLEADDGLPAELIGERSRLAVLGAPVLVALRGRERLSGILAVGPRRSGERYTVDDLAFLQALADQAALAVERVQVVASLEQRMREMNVLGQVAQAANYATEFDQLLLQIYEQVNLLARAPFFSIILRDPNTDELYYALIVEGGERRPEREGVRWRMGRDLLSEVVRGGQPIRLDDYGAELQRRGHSAPYDNAGLKAWIGVPLSGPEGALGVMCVGSPGPGLTYSDEQLRILWQVADQAAVAIDKERLFRETETRARQLTALNEISRELATVFHDSERLLELITDSAVEILEAEAGSLLMIDPDTQELEFKVVVGSQAQSLVGTRLPPGTGLVGIVADRGEPIIVNDANRDPRWFSGVDRDLDFRTSTVLAAPLIGNSGVIGVLEVINKRNGGVFVEDDRRLLVAFAGQASIAIENARLFQMTDEQLAARVDELDTMQRIDHELNETLKLERVMAITLEWAMRESAATAGALGMIVSEPYGLRMMVHEGYPDGIFGGDGFWPLEGGCLERVARTGQPEVVADVLQDAGYTAILPGARCQMAVPLFSEGQVSGVILLESLSENAFTLLHLDFISRLAEHASPALANAILLAQLEQANEARSEFVGFVAHELKTPMTSIQGFADLLLGGVVGPLNDQQKRFLSTIRFNVERMNTLVSDLNDVTKLQTNRMSMDKAAIDFREVVMETLRPVQNQIDNKQQTVRLELASRLPLIWADQNRMIQVLTNLVTNANKYTPAGGELVIYAAPSRNHWDAGGAPEVLHIYVKDNGIGISQEDQERLFTPYFRTTNPAATEQPGTGLGLVIVRGIVEQHGGRIWVESQPGKGSTFHLTIPLASAVPEAQARAN